MTKCYQLRFSKSAVRQFDKLDQDVKRKLRAYINKHINTCENPRFTGKALRGKYAGLWRYRMGNYRLICQIQDEELLVLAVKIGHRKDVY